MGEEEIRAALSERESLSARLNTMPKVSKFALEVEALAKEPEKLKAYLDTVTYDPSDKTDDDVLVKYTAHKYNFTMEEAREAVREQYGDPEERTTLQKMKIKDESTEARQYFNSQRQAVLEATQKDSRDTVPTELVTSTVKGLVGEAPTIQSSRGEVQVAVPVDKRALEATMAEFLTAQISNGNIVLSQDGKLSEADQAKLADFKTRMSWFISGPAYEQKLYDAAVVATEKRLRAEYSGKEIKAPDESKQKESKQAESIFEKARREQLAGPKPF